MIARICLKVKEECSEEKGREMSSTWHLAANGWQKVMDVSALGAFLRRVMSSVVVYKAGSWGEWDNSGMFTSHSSSCEPNIFRSRMNSFPHMNMSELALVDGNRNLGALSPDMMYLHGFPLRSWVYMQCNPSWRCFGTLTEYSVIIPACV